VADELAVVPSDDADWVELARSSSGRLFRKHILTKGDLIHPKTGSIIPIDDQYLDTMVDNFEKGVCPIVQVPLAGPRNEHTEDPERNLGEVVGLEKEGDKFFAVIDVRDSDKADKVGKTILGASAMFSQNYLDTKTGQHVGPTLLHVCATNRPYVRDLEDYEELVAASSDNNSDVVVLSTAEGTDEMPEMTRDEMIAALRDDHGIDVVAMHEELEASRPAVALTQQLANALVDGDIVQLSAGQEMTIDDVRGGVLALAEENSRLGQSVVNAADQITELTNELDEVTQKQADTLIDSLIEQGRIAPAKKDDYLKLCMTDFDMFEAMVPDEPIVKLSKESGTSETDDVHDTNEKAITSEIDRYVKADFAKPYVRTQ